MADSPEQEFDERNGTSKIVRIVERETSDRFKSMEKKWKRWQWLVGIALPVLGALVAAVRWESGLGKASAIEANTRDIVTLQMSMKQLVEQAKEERQERAADRAAHDAELRWVADHLADFKAELDDVARAAGVPVRRRVR